MGVNLNHQVLKTNIFSTKSPETIVI